jgi:eukaryotic-like serine/threonine-protein kinase
VTSSPDLPGGAPDSRISSLAAALTDRYRLERELGAGGMATVYLAEDVRHHRKVAIKVLHPELSAVLGPDRFLKEIELTASLQHPHILPLFDSGSEDGKLWYAMPFIDGETLRARLARENQLPIADAVRIATEAADALDYAHRRGVVHRDIKPENILLHDGHALVADFGIALAVEQAGGSRMTQTGLSLGTPAYMAPEQAMGARSVDARADIYALGAVTYEMLAGEPPFTGPNAQAILAQVITAEPRSLALQRKSVPASIDAAVRTALEKLPADRFASAKEFADALARPAESVRVPAADPAGRRRRPSWWALAAMGAVLVATSAAAFLLGTRRRPTTEQVSFRQVTFTGQAIATARFAPDGQTIVFDARRQSSAPAIYVIRPDYPDARPLGLDDTHLLAVSSKNELAVITKARFVAHRMFIGTLARVPLEGGTPREMLDSVREGDWSPDGSSLAIIHVVGGRDRLEYPVGTVLFDTPGYISDLRISPDGERVAFFDHVTRFPYDDRGGVDVVDRARHRTVLAKEFAGEEGLAWSADGRSVLFSASAGPDMQIHEVGLHGGDRLALPTPGTMMMQDVSRGGRWLAIRDDREFQIRAHPPGRVDELDLSWLDQSVTAAISRDGRMLGITDASEFASADYATIVRKTDGSPAVRLGDGWISDFTPDGQWVVTVVPSTPPQLRLYPVGAGETRRLDFGAFGVLSDARVWGPGADSTLACGTISEHAPRCYLRTTSATTWRPVTDDGADHGYVSPDGHLVLTTSPDGSNRLYDLRTRSGRPVRALRAADRVLRWSPDGKSLWVWQTDTMPIMIDRVDIATDQRARLTTLVPQSGQGVSHIIGVGLADDPRVYMYGTVVQSSQLFVIEGAR